MNDLEITRLCAEAMGFSPLIAIATDKSTVIENLAIGQYWYCPLHNDAQAMALVKKLKLSIESYEEEGADCYVYSDTDPRVQAFNIDLNRAIVECVAKMQAGKNER